jgi:hypothetical protein
MKSKIKQLINSIFNDNVLISDPTLIANICNKFFTTIADDIADLINPVPDTYQPHLNTPDSPNNLPKFDMSDTPILEGEILDCIKSLEDKKNSGHDGFFYTSP